MEKVGDIYVYTVSVPDDEKGSGTDLEVCIGEGELESKRSREECRG